MGIVVEKLPKKKSLLAFRAQNFIAKLRLSIWGLLPDI